ncbi:MAG: DUF2130 domain-containing protein [Gammaproteobacteria bacterium]|jgi:hypothetical protein
MASTSDSQTRHIQCPHCGGDIDVNDILYHQVEEELARKFRQKLADEQQRYSKQFEELESEKAALEAQKRAHEQAVAEAVRVAISEEKKRLQVQLRTSLEQEQAERFALLQNELNEKSERLRELNKLAAEMERLKREKEELRDVLEAESQKKLTAMLSDERAKIRKNEEEKALLKLSEREQVIEQLKQQLTEAQRKAEQGSMQLQGEAQELVIEDYLVTTFPLDTIEEIKKGAHGADCLQVINTRSRSNCGSIYYESKRAKHFAPSWIEKFKHDIREKGADIGVLVTAAMPADMPRMGLRDGVWICTFSEFQGLAAVLRESLIRLDQAVSAQENRGDKMDMLYDYLTGNEFRMQVEAIVEGFTQMQADLESEKRAMQGIWKKREKQIRKVLLNTTQMHGSVKGIAGSAVQSVPMLELNEGDDNGEV